MDDSLSMFLLAVGGALFGFWGGWLVRGGQVEALRKILKKGRKNG